MADGHPLQQPLGITPSLLRVRQAVEQRGEFIAAHARQQGLAAQAVLELLGDPAQHPVTGVMAKGVVDALETVQVHVHQRLGLVRALVAQQSAFGRLVETAAVQQAGQRVGNGLVLQLLVQVAHCRHVQHGHHHGLLVGWQRRARQCHRNKLAGQCAQLRVVHAVDFLPQVSAVELRFKPWAGSGKLHQVEQLGTLNVLHGGRQQAGNGRVGKADHALCVHHQNAFGGVLQNRPIERPGGFQLPGQALQHAPVALLVEQGLDLGLENLGVERFEHVVHGAAGVAFEHGRFGLFVGGQENDRCQPRTLAAAHQPGNFKAVHLRHLHVQQDQVDIMLQQGA